MLKCVHWKRHSKRNWDKSRCGKESKFTDDGGRDLCTKHFKKWFKKRYKEDYDEFIKE